MSHALDRLINLAKKTGDKLIIHDSVEGKDMVILGIDDYEELALERQDVRAMSSGQLIDQINRDIAIWRSNRDMDEIWDEEMEGEDPNEMNRSPEEEAFAKSMWHSAAAVLGEEYGWLDDSEEESPDMASMMEMAEMMSSPNEAEEATQKRGEQHSVDQGWTREAGSGNAFAKSVSEHVEEFVVEEIPFEPVEDTEEDDFEDSLPGEDPIFLEEPIQ
jgi:hypothetical protein